MILIHQRYEIVKRLGEGGTSTVLQVHDHRLHMDFAMKRTRSIVDEDKAVFLHEIAVMSKLHHEQIPRIIDQFEEDGYGCVVMELIHGMPLLTYMQKHGTISEPMIMNWMMQILDIFSYLHHLDPLLLYVDLKPQNIMIDDKGMLYLIDFGSSIFHHQTQIKSATPRYAPDDVLKYHNASIQSDIYSIGMTFYVLYHGHFPKERSSHDRLDDVLFHCMEERVEDRYKHVEAIQKALQKIRVSQSHHLPFALVFLSFFLIFLCGGFYFHENEDSSQNEMYFSAMQQKDYEQAVMLRPAQISAYQKRYEEVCGVEDCMKGLLDILHLAKQYHGDESEDVLFLLASRSMLLDTPEGYQIAETYFGILNKKMNRINYLPTCMNWRSFCRNNSCVVTSRSIWLIF